MSKLSLLWHGRSTGLWQAMNEFALVHGYFPQFDIGSGYQWFRLASRTAHRIRMLKNQWQGRTVVCIGNGPSLNQTDWSCLRDAHVIGTNRAFQVLDRIQTDKFHLVIQDNIRLRELERELSEVVFPLHVGSWFFTPDATPPSWLTPKKENVSVYLPILDWTTHGNALRINGSLNPRFSDDPTRGVFAAYSIIFTAIQFAYFFGAKRIVCIGIDMDYVNGISFVPGVRNIFPTFDYETQCKPIFDKMKIVLDNRGVEMINSTPGGKVDAIPRMPLRDAVRGVRLTAPVTSWAA